MAVEIEAIASETNKTVSHETALVPRTFKNGTGIRVCGIMSITNHKAAGSAIRGRDRKTPT
jgi:hypothetical protein